ncbi:hypothetical protein EVAR_10376_1 [Eumeta japonica]|uniref:Uncharacterized protein n=1 Tax=Eumeta variegata TaxID=151549 RepID=A0A4C1UDU9_EUMVA|nr:hypothetical protein EVAR_10376_1 [Eumeta japonica]
MPEWKGRVPLTRSHCERITSKRDYDMGKPNERTCRKICCEMFRNLDEKRCKNSEKNCVCLCCKYKTAVICSDNCNSIKNDPEMRCKNQNTNGKCCTTTKTETVHDRIDCKDDAHASTTTKKIVETADYYKTGCENENADLKISRDVVNFHDTQSCNESDTKNFCSNKANCKKSVTDKARCNEPCRNKPRNKTCCDTLCCERLDGRAVTNRAVTSRAATNRAVRSRVVISRAVTSRAVLNRVVTSRAVIGLSVTNLAMSSRAVISHVVTSRAVTSRVVTSHSITDRAVSNHAVTNQTMKRHVGGSFVPTTHSIPRNMCHSLNIYDGARASRSRTVLKFYLSYYRDVFMTSAAHEGGEWDGAVGGDSPRPTDAIVFFYHFLNNHADHCHNTRISEKIHPKALNSSTSVGSGGVRVALLMEGSCPLRYKLISVSRVESTFGNKQVLKQIRPSVVTACFLSTVPA